MDSHRWVAQVRMMPSCGFPVPTHGRRTVPTLAWPNRACRGSWVRVSSIVCEEGVSVSLSASCVGNDEWKQWVEQGKTWPDRSRQKHAVLAHS